MHPAEAEKLMLAKVMIGVALVAVLWVVLGRLGMRGTSLRNPRIPTLTRCPGCGTYRPEEEPCGCGFRPTDDD